MTTTANTPPVTLDRNIDTFGIALPPNWMRIPLDREFDEFVRQQRTLLGVHAELSITGQRQFELIMRQLRNDCRRADVTMAAMMLSPIESEGDDESIGLLSASCTLSSISRSRLGTELPLTVNTLAAALTRIPESDDGTETVNLEAPKVVEVHAGAAVKVVRLVTLPPAPISRERVALFSQTFFVPYDNEERAAVVSFATSSPEFAQPLSTLFDAMMTTFRMYGGDDLTDPFPTVADSATII